MKYKVTVKTTNESYVIEQHQLLNEIKNHYPEANKAFYDLVYNLCVNRPRTPYAGTTIRIERTDFVPLDKKIADLELGPNSNFECGKNVNYNEWIMLNKKTKKSYAFTNLAALARTLNTNYAKLRNNIIYSNVFVIGDYVFTRVTTLEKDFYHARIQEIL